MMVGFHIANDLDENLLDYIWAKYKIVCLRFYYYWYQKK